MTIGTTTDLQSKTPEYTSLGYAQDRKLIPVMEEIGKKGRTEVKDRRAASSTSSGDGQERRSLFLIIFIEF